MKHAVFAVCIVLVNGIWALGTAAPDFSGYWIRDAAASDAMATYVDGKVTPMNVNLPDRRRAPAGFCLPGPHGRGDLAAGALQDAQAADQVKRHV